MLQHKPSTSTCGIPECESRGTMIKNYHCNNLTCVDIPCIHEAFPQCEPNSVSADGPAG